MARKTFDPAWYVWRSPDGRVSKRYRTISGALRSAVNAHLSTCRLHVSMDTTVALALWPDLKTKGWCLLRVAP